MKKKLIIRCAVVGMAVLTMSANVTAAINQEAAAGDLALISMLSAQSKANLADAALSGDVDAIAEMSKRSDAVDAAASAAQQAYSVIERALAGGDADAAASAMDDLANALQQAIDALNGVVPQDKKSKQQQWKESQSNTGGGPGRSGDPVDMYRKLSDTSTMNNLHHSLWGSFFSSGRSTGDRDATPE